MFIPEKGIDFPSLLIKDTKLTEPILEIAKITGIKHQGTLNSIVEETQKSWLRSGERWEMDHKKFSQHEFELMPLLNELHMVETLFPRTLEYDYFLVLGALDKTVIRRFNFLNKFVEENNIIKENNSNPKLVLLTGKRNLLDEEKERLKKEFNLEGLETESDMMFAIINKTSVALNLKNLKIIVIDTPLQTDKSGKIVRPSTPDTIKYWISNFNPQPGKCLAISTQPFVVYQDIVLRSYLPKSFELETVGPQDPRQITIALYLDTLARCLYQLKEIVK